MRTLQEPPMKAWLIDNFDHGIDQLRIATVMDPSPEPGEVVVAVRYAALNPADRYLSEGQYPARPSLPHILGRDGIGEVVEIGPDVHDFRVGQSVVLLRSEIGVSRPGMFAERVAIPTASLVSPPKGWSDEQAAAAP